LKHHVPAEPTAKPVIAVTSGDPAGIGPEITGRCFSAFEPRRSIALLVGSVSVIEPWLSRPVASNEVVDEDGAVAALQPDRTPRVMIYDTGCREPYPSGEDSRGGGIHAGTAIDVAARLAKAGLAQAIVTAPISKQSLNQGGYPYNGHTEMLAHLLDSPRCQMMMVFRSVRVVPLTRHVPVRDVSRHITSEKLMTCLKVVKEALVDQFGVPDPHIAVAALNPHAGDGGLLGTEEIEVIGPALREARRAGIRVTGPVAGDALFQSIQNGTYDAFVSMYHDQGLIPFKMVSKRRGVNVTVGLPVIRTSVDHGVAYDIAGKGIAEVASLKEAYHLAETLLETRRAGRGG
jgi:4-hydroxythreonine-4-phosphate dehydrogenase